MKIKVLALFNISLLFFALSLSAASYMYKWVDANGEVQYTERPPADGVSYERIRMADKGKDKSTPIPVVENPLNKTEQTPQDKQADESSKNYNDWRAENCKVAKQNLDVLQAGGRISSGDGENGFLSDEEIKTKIEEMQTKVEKYCGEAE